MEYDCHIVPIDRTIVTEDGPAVSLCTDCRCPDCTNPIREVMVSQFGIPQKMRLWVVHDIMRQVVACKGYIGDQHVQTSTS